MNKTTELFSSHLRCKNFVCQKSQQTQDYCKATPQTSLIRDLTKLNTRFISYCYILFGSVCDTAFRQKLVKPDLIPTMYMHQRGRPKPVQIITLFGCGI